MMSEDVWWRDVRLHLINGASYDTFYMKHIVNHIWGLSIYLITFDLG